MIGVISHDSEKKIAAEFFELFKTPWEFYHRDRFYDVVVSTRDEIVKFNSKLTIIYVSEKNPIEPAQGIRVQSEYRKRSVERNGISFPIYGHLVFVRIHHPKFRNPDNQNPSLSRSGYTDLPFKGETLMEVSLDDFNSQPVTYSLSIPYSTTYISYSQSLQLIFLTSNM